MTKNIYIVGSGNAALCAGIAALENGAKVKILESAKLQEAGGNSKYTAGAMRFVYETNEDLIPLLKDPKEEKIAHTDFGSYPKEKFQSDLLSFNDGNPLNSTQNTLIDKSYETMLWLSKHNIKFDPIYSRQSFEKDGKYIFWGGLTLAAEGEGVGLVEAELKEYLNLGGQIQYETKALALKSIDGKVVGIEYDHCGEIIEEKCDAVILACGGFEASTAMRKEIMGAKWKNCLVRGTKHNLGKGLQMALDIGAKFEGNPEGCHATPMDANMPNYGNLSIPHIDRKNYRKICYFLGVMVNVEGNRFVDEGINFRNYTYAQFGKAILDQPNSCAWQIFDSKVDNLLYNEYRFWDASYIEANTLEGLVNKMHNVNKKQTLQTLLDYNSAVDRTVEFDPTILDGKRTNGLPLNKTNWANLLDTPPFKAYPVKCGITFTYGGLKINENAAVLAEGDKEIKGLFACGEIVGGIFYNGYPGGSGLTSGAVFGKIAGTSAAKHE